MSYDSLAAKAAELIRTALAEPEGQQRMLMLEEGVRLHRAALDIAHSLDLPTAGTLPDQAGVQPAP